MAIADDIGRALMSGMGLARGRVLGVEPNGRVRVKLAMGVKEELSCDVLETKRHESRFRANDLVLVARPETPGTPGIVLGVIGARRYAEADASPAAASTDGSDEHRVRHRKVVIEAGEELTLQCGEASITIRRDGKIVIRGEHILSRARGTQRIKGGSVAIN